MAGKLTPQDRVVLRAIPDDRYLGAHEIAATANLQTSWPAETAKRHCHRLVKLGLLDAIGGRNSPAWRRTALAEDASRTNGGGDGV